jgi:hypothetical protein
MADRSLVTVLDPEDEYPHEPDPVPNYNESMYLNSFDIGAEVAGWFRIGNRVNEGYAEVSVCTYLPGGRVGFAYGRPHIDSNDRLAAGGLAIDVVEPFAHLRLAYDGRVCVLAEPAQMSDPRAAFTSNPWVDCEIALDVRGVSPMYGGRSVYEDGTAPELDAEQSFAKAHYEQHCSATGTIRVGDETIELDGLGLRDKSWGPRHWQAISWYRWLPMAFTPDFAMMISVIGGRPGGMVLEGGEYHLIRRCTLDSDWDERHHQTGMRAHVETDDATYDVTGEVVSLIPLRHRRTTPDGQQLLTRITEAMTRFECNGLKGMGMSEYLDQVVDGRPVGPDVA